MYALPVIPRLSSEWVREFVALLVAIGVAVLAVTVIAGTDRATVLFRDGDSMLPVLVMRSLDVGQPQDWAMSSVLFIPELTLFAAIWAFGWGVNGTFTMNAIVNFVALYGAFRVVAGSRRKAAAPVAGALMGYGAFVCLAVLDGSSSRDSFELASLLATTTYYSSTVLAVALTVGWLRRAVTPVRRPHAALVAVAVVAAVATLSNPLYALWATAPLVLLIGYDWYRRRDRVPVWSGAAMLGGTILGFMARIPLARFIANDGLGYIDPTRAPLSAIYYTDLIIARWHSPGGPAALALISALISTAIACTVLLAREGDRAAWMVAASGWLLAAFVTVVVVLLGTHAARYLQPVAFAPAMALTVIPALLPRVHPPQKIRKLITIMTVPATIATVAAAAPLTASKTARPDPDLQCVTEWVTASAQTGAGQYWTIRLPKAHLDDPRRLIQIDAALNPYEWLVNRADTTNAGNVDFLVIDDQSAPYTLPAPHTLEAAELTRCGRYTIAAFERPLPLGTPHP